MTRPKTPARCAIPILKKIFDTADERGVSNAFMAAKMDVYPAQVTDWRSGRVTPSIFVTMELAQTLGMELVLQ